MAAGDLLTADWQIEIQALLTGAGTDYRIRPKGISGLLGVPPTKTADVVFQGQAGAYGSRDYAGPRVILVDYVIVGDDADDAVDLLNDLSAAWAPTLTDVELHGRVPTGRHWMVSGRPRGLSEDLEFVRAQSGGVAGVIGEFHALDPTVTWVT